MTYMTDGLTNVLTGMGVPDRDKQAGLTRTAPANRGEQYWQDMYRGSWVARAIVDMPANDATREWREWQADGSDISAIEAYEGRDNINIANNMKLAHMDAAKFGYGYVYFDLGDDPELPVNVNTVRRGGLRFANHVDSRSVIRGDIQDDPMLEGYGRPEWFEINSMSASSQRIHPSRFIKLYGDLKDSGFGGIQAESVLQRANDAINQYDSAVHNVAALVHEAKVDVWRIPDLASILSDPDQEAAFIKLQRLSNQMKGVHGAIFQDGGKGDGQAKTEYDRKSSSFATLPDVIGKFEDQVCAAVRFSKAYLFGQSASGLGNSGAMELEMDYAKIQQVQKTQYQPAMSVFDECLIVSALGSRPADVFYNWRSLWSMSDADRAKIGLDIANTYKALADSELLPVDVLSPSVVNSLTERGGLAGLETEYNGYTEESGDVDDDDLAGAVVDGISWQDNSGIAYLKDYATNG